LIWIQWLFLFFVVILLSRVVWNFLLLWRRDVCLLSISLDITTSSSCTTSFIVHHLHTVFLILFTILLLIIFFFFYFNLSFVVFLRVIHSFFRIRSLRNWWIFQIVILRCLNRSSCSCFFLSGSSIWSWSMMGFVWSWRWNNSGDLSTTRFMMMNVSNELLL